VGALRAILKIERPQQVEYTWMSEATKGVESIVALTFQAQGEQTEVTLRHTGVPDDEMGCQHHDGWTWVLSILAERFGAKPPAATRAQRPAPTIGPNQGRCVCKTGNLIASKIVIMS
jgi:Activator of Hsp90 ATPase homolog 1-like protein